MESDQKQGVGKREGKNLNHQANMNHNSRHAPPAKVPHVEKLLVSTAAKLVLPEGPTSAFKELINNCDEEQSLISGDDNAQLQSPAYVLQA